LFVEKFISAFDDYITATEACHVAAGDSLFLIAIGESWHSHEGKPRPAFQEMPAKCPYCARPLKGFGLKCHACRRYVLRWHHVVLFSLVGLVALVFALDALFRSL
jgi:hypothetical protein